MSRSGSGEWAAVSAARPEATGVFDPEPGAYLGGSQGEARHRISFTLQGNSLRNLRVDGLGMAARATVEDGRVETSRVGFGLTATWVDATHVEGRVRMRGRWGRGEAFTFSARRRVGDVLSGG